jgi:hypothetical protein
MTPTADEIRVSVDTIDLALTALIRFAEDGNEAHWNRATGLLQDACEAIGYDFRPLSVAPVRTPEAIYDDAAYARGRGGV